ncbi:DesA/ISL3 alpha bundle tail domain-containing protein [Legionella pneumophila]
MLGTVLLILLILLLLGGVQLVYNYRQSLQQIWLKKVSSQKELIESLNQWCKRAEQSGLDVLHQFSLRLKSYVLIGTDGSSV